MARHANTNWNLGGTEGGGIPTWKQASIAVLMDVRDELQRLNRLLNCQNFTAIPYTLSAIKRNTNRKKRTRKAK